MKCNIWLVAFFFILKTSIIAGVLAPTKWLKVYFGETLERLEDGQVRYVAGYCIVVGDEKYRGPELWHATFSPEELEAVSLKPRRSSPKYGARYLKHDTLGIVAIAFISQQQPSNLPVQEIKAFILGSEKFEKYLCRNLEYALLNDAALRLKLLEWYAKKIRPYKII
jgi:hypothetical protein